MTIPVDIILEVNSSQIKHNLRVETSREKFSSSDKLDKVKNHKTRSHIENKSCAQSKLMDQVGILEKNHPSQMKINPTLTPQVNKQKVGSAANLNYLDDPRSNSKDDRKIPGIDPHPFKIKNTPAINKIHQGNKFTPDGNLKIGLMKKPGKHLLAEGEKFSATGGNLKTPKMKNNPGYNKFLQVDIGEHIKAPRRRLEIDDFNSLQTTCKLEKTVEIVDTPTRIFEQLSQIQSGSVKITQAVKITESGSMMKSLNHTKSKLNLRPGQIKRPG